MLVTLLLSTVNMCRRAGEKGKGWKISSIKYAEQILISSSHSRFENLVAAYEI